MEEAFSISGPAYAIGGFLLGAVIYVGADKVLERMAATSPKRTGRDPGHVLPDAKSIPETPKVAAVAGSALLVGAVLDGIPESLATGLSLRAGGPSLGAVLLIAVFLSNVPESMGSAAAMRDEGRTRRYIVSVWAAVALVCTAATVAGYVLMSGLPPEVNGGTLALAAGGILAMLADTMFPEAVRHGGPFVALATAVGFSGAMLLTSLTGA